MKMLKIWINKKIIFMKILIKTKIPSEVENFNIDYDLWSSFIVY